MQSTRHKCRCYIRAESGSDEGRVRAAVCERVKLRSGFV